MKRRSKKALPWDHLLWGVTFTGSIKGDRPMLIGNTWHTEALNTGTYLGEPTRALLFTTRDEARAYCDHKHAMYRTRDDCCKDWRFKPVRVREIVRLHR